MKSCLKNILFLIAVVFAFGAFQVEDASAQGPIIRKMREKLNNGRPLLPFISDSELDKPKAPTKKPTLAAKPQPKKTPTPATRAPTPAKQLEKFPRIKLDSGASAASNNSNRNSQIVRSEGFGMAIEKAGESFVVSQVNPQGNAASAGVMRGDIVTGIGGAKLTAIEEFEGIADAMSGGDRVEFDVSRRGSKTQKVIVQFGQLDESKEEESAKFEIAPSTTNRSFSDRYEPSVGSGLESVYDGAQKPSSILTPTPAPTTSNRIESFEELDFPALDGRK